MKAKLDGRDPNVRAKITANYDCTNLYADEMIKLFFKLYKKIGFVNRLTVIVHGVGGEDSVYKCEP